MYGEQDIGKLTKIFQKHIDSLLESCINQKLVEAFHQVMLPWVTHATLSSKRFGGHSSFQEPTHEMIYYLLQTLNNLLFHSTKNTAKLRRQFAVEIPVVSELILPYIDLLLDELKRATQYENEPENEEAIGYNNDLRKKIRLVLRLLVSATYNIRALHAILRDRRCNWRGLLKSSLCTRELYTLSLIVKLAINVSLDSVKQEHGEQCSMKLLQGTSWWCCKPQWFHSS